MALETIFLDIMNSVGSHTLLNVGIFAVSILAIHYILRSVMHIVLAGLSGVGFLFLSNTFFGTAYATDPKTLAFFAAGGAVVYLASILLKGLLKISKK